VGFFGGAEVGVRAGEIAKNHGNTHHVDAVHRISLGRYLLRAHEPHFLRARGRTTVTVDQVAVVALLAQEQTVAARAHARRAGAVWFGATVCRAAVVGQAVAVVTALGALFDTVAAGGRHANVRNALVALVVVLEFAEVVAAVARQDVSVVATFRRR